MMSTLTLLELLPSIIDRVVYLLCVSIFLVSFCGSLWKTFSTGWRHVYRLHQIPCYRCAFFTGDYRLKCTVHPSKALTEVAIDCVDYEYVKISQASYQKAPLIENDLKE